MLVAISDIHFVDGTAGDHNLPFGAFELFVDHISSLAKRKQAKEVKILLLGDIVDLIRSAQWFNVSLKDRPWGVQGVKDIPTPRKNSPTEKKCLGILGRVPSSSLQKPNPPSSLKPNTILAKNWKTFKLFRELQFADAKGDTIPTQIIYVAGNHDRLCNLYPSVRDALKLILGLTVGSKTVDGDPTNLWWYKNEFLCEKYGMYARHGHQFDIWNFGGGNDFTRNGYLKAPIGDVIATEFAVKIPWLLESMRKQKPQAVPQSLVDKAKDIDNVRPLASIIEWLYYRIKHEDQKRVRKILDDVFDTVVKDILRIELVQKWRSPETHYDEILRAASSRWLRWLPSALVDLLDAEDLLPLFIGATGGPKDPEKDPYMEAVYYDDTWKKNKKIQFMLLGHTHRPLQRPLDISDGTETIYVNTGTWRNRIHRTVALDRAPDFVEFKQMTYTVFFMRDEDMKDKASGTLSFDMWTGTRKKH